MLNAATLLPDLSPRDLCLAVSWSMGPHQLVLKMRWWDLMTPVQSSAGDGWLWPWVLCQGSVQGSGGVVLQKFSARDSPCPEGFLIPSLPPTSHQGW